MPFRMHLRSDATPPDAVDLRETGCVSPVKDQGDTSSCVGHAISSATETAFALAGDPLGWIPSESDIYRGARAVERARATPLLSALLVLVDDGSRTEDAIAFLAGFGVRPRVLVETSDGRNSDAEPDTINDELTFGALLEASERLITGPYAIDPGDPDALTLVRRALASSIPVRIDAYVGESFAQWTPSQGPYATPDHESGGGHAMYLVGYNPDGFIVRNSWGKWWGDDGDALLSEGFVRSSWALYPWVCRRAG